MNLVYSVFLLANAAPVRICPDYQFCLLTVSQPVLAMVVIVRKIMLLYLKSSEAAYIKKVRK